MDISFTIKINLASKNSVNRKNPYNIFIERREVSVETACVLTYEPSRTGPGQVYLNDDTEDWKCLTPFG
jgi:hypothetical protein